MLAGALFAGRACLHDSSQDPLLKQPSITHVDTPDEYSEMAHTMVAELEKIQTRYLDNPDLRAGDWKLTLNIHDFRLSLKDRSEIEFVYPYSGVSGSKVDFIWYDHTTEHRNSLSASRGEHFAEKAQTSYLNSIVRVLELQHGDVGNFTHSAATSGSIWPWGEDAAPETWTIPGNCWTSKDVSLVIKAPADDAEGIYSATLHDSRTGHTIHFSQEAAHAAASHLRGTSVPEDRVEYDALVERAFSILNTGELPELSSLGWAYVAHAEVIAPKGTHLVGPLYRTLTKDGSMQIEVQKAHQFDTETGPIDQCYLRVLYSDKDGKAGKVIETRQGLHAVCEGELARDVFKLASTTRGIKLSAK